MIGTIDIKVNAAHPNMPLLPIYAFVGSPSQVRIINVPKAIGKWAVTSVQITANYPDNTSRSVTATLVGGCWSATLPASASVGQSLMGFKVTASGTDEAGAAVTGYVLGKGDVFILNDDSTITIGETTYYVHLVDSQPTAPKKGDLCKIDGTWKMYNGTAWEAFGGGSGDVKHSEFSDMTADLNPDESSIGEVMTKVNTLISKLKGTTAMILAILAFSAFAAVDVQTAKLSTLPGKTMVVTNVVGAAAISDLALKQDKLPYATNAIPAGVISGAPWATNASISNDFPIVTNTYTKSEANASFVSWVEDKNGDKTAVTIGTRSPGVDVGVGSLSIGDLAFASGSYSVGIGAGYAIGLYSLAQGSNVSASGQNSSAFGDGTEASGTSAFAIGSRAKANNNYSFAWGGSNEEEYNSHGVGTFNINPVGGLSGLYIGEQNLTQINNGILSTAENTAGTIASNLVDHTNVRFSNEVLAVGLGIGTNEVAQINAILNEMGETPISEATTIGALLAALAAAVAWLKKKSVKKDSNGYYFED